jgi:hypothetical protein
MDGGGDRVPVPDVGDRPVLLGPTDTRGCSALPPSAVMVATKKKDDVGGWLPLGRNLMAQIKR